jgi:hypothetical protein
MGLLDDAIREHLDLKRQRGADPGEIERLEREALGPVRREPTARTLDASPHLDVHVEEAHHLDPATELLQQASPPPEPRRGFLRRNRPAPAAEPELTDFADHLSADLHLDPVAAHPDPYGHDDHFDPDDPFLHEPPATPDPAFAEHDPATYEHAGEPALAVPVAGEQPPAVDDAPPAASPAQPAAEAEPPHLIFDNAPPPKRPSFAPVPPTNPEPDPAPVEDAAPADEHPTTILEAVEPEPAAPAAPPETAADQRARADAARETREWSVEEAFAEEDAGEQAAAPIPAEEDVLEETPEFLQDTPDHDRLWFEQRPPRDFDFDG